MDSEALVRLAQCLREIRLTVTDIEMMVIHSDESPDQGTKEEAWHMLQDIDDNIEKVRSLFK